MFGPAGLPELLIMSVFGLAFWVLPLAAVVWIGVTLHRIRLSVDAIRASVERLDRGESRP